MTFEERMAELGVDLSDITPVIDRIYCGDELRDAINEYYADIIDCMETRIVNLTGELNYLQHSECRMCMPFDQSLRRRCGECAVYKGIPDEWSIDDGYSHQVKFDAYEQELAYEQKTGRKLFDWLESWPKSI